MDPLEKEINLLRSLVDVAPTPLVILDGTGRFLRVNPRGMEVLGYSSEELRQMRMTDLLMADDTEGARSLLIKRVEEEIPPFRTFLASRSGERKPVELSGCATGGHLFITLKDLSERFRVEEEIEKIKLDFARQIREKDQYAQEKMKEIEAMREEAIRLSYIDDLTGIYNHRFFIEQLTMEVERQKRYPSPLSLLMIDIDYFKQYNDTNGHLAGDQALKAIALLIRRGVRHTDIVARYGGEEFSAILINTGKQGAFEIAERVRAKVAETRFPNEKVQPNEDLTVSVGVGTFSPPVATLTDLIREADNALYRAKRAGRNRIEG